MKSVSAGLLMYRMEKGEPEFFLAHPGGPYFRKKDHGFWTIPKGLVEGEEDLLTAAKREFKEETGIEPFGDMIELGWVQLKGGKKVYAWAFLRDGPLPESHISNTFTIEWPPKSGKIAAFPEIDQVSFFKEEEALTRINEAQRNFIEILIGKLSS